MKSKLFLGAILTVVLIGGSSFAATGSKKVTLEEAQAAALKKIPGTVESSGMKKKNFSFNILSNDGIKREVVVGRSGKVKRVVVRE